MSNYMKREIKNNIAKIIVGVAFVGISIFGLISVHINRDTYTVTITDKQVKRSDKSDKYLIFGKTDEGKTIVFENTDSFIEGKLDSSDIYGELKIDNKYEIKAYGYRIPLISSYQNIAKVQEVK